MGVNNVQVEYDMGDLEYQMTMIVKAIKSMDAMIDMYKKQMKAEQARKMHREGRNPPTNAELAKLRKELFCKDQDAMLNDVVMIHVPEDFGIPLPQVVVQVAKLFRVKMKESDVVIAMRVGPPLGPGPIEPFERRPSRPIIVRLAKIEQRAALLYASRYKRNSCNTTVILHQLYIYERLTRRNQFLLQKTRDVAKQAGWIHVWVMNAKILVRCAFGDDSVEIRHLRDLYELCESKAPQLLATISGGSQDDAEESDGTSSTAACN